MIITEDGMKLYKKVKWEKRLKNVPNILAFSRILLAPILFMFYVNRDLFVGVDESWLNFFAALIFTVASITDFFDGYIARHFNAVSKLGEILDPLADKMLILAGFLGLMYIGVANVWAIYIILVREFFITGLRIQMASENISVKASFAGKLKTTAQMGSIGFLTMGWYGGEFILWLAVILTLYSGVDYIKSYMDTQK